MPFPDDLLHDAHHLAAMGGKKPRQSSLRRAVSTAYYALFHLLVADFVLNWRPKDQRARLGRMFDHRKMIQAVFKFKSGTLSPAEKNLSKVINAFSQLQEHRHTADYNVAWIWSRDGVMDALQIADEAFVAWKKIRKEKIAQDHLMTMFGARRL